MSTCDSLGQPYRSRCANLEQAVVGDMTALLMFTDPLSSCNNDDNDYNSSSSSNSNSNNNDDDNDNGNADNNNNGNNNDLMLSSP